MRAIRIKVCMFVSLAASGCPQHTAVFWKRCSRRAQVVTDDLPARFVVVIPNDRLFPSISAC
jgi:hypothetical protein